MCVVRESFREKLESIVAAIFCYGGGEVLKFWFSTRIDLCFGLFIHQIHLCTCIRGSTSTNNSRKRRGGTTVSCKNCGGRPVIDVKSSSSCLLTTVLELTSLLNPDFTWTKISKGCRSSSRKPRKSTLNTVNFACGKLLTDDTTDLEMPVSESEKLGVSLLECRFSEKAEHIPIKKRRFLFNPSSPTRNITNPPLEAAERHETSPKLNSISNANPNSVPATSGAVTETCESGNKDQKLEQNKLVKDDDFSAISILAAAACSNCVGGETDRFEGSKVPKDVKSNENNVKKEPDSHTSTTSAAVEESKLNDSSSCVPSEPAINKTNQEPNIHNSPARDVRFSWDLNTVMDAWEEPSINEHEIPASDAANDKATSVNNSENNEPLTREFEITQKAVVVKTESMHDKPTNSASDNIPVTRTLTVENPTHATISKWANLSGQSSCGVSSNQAVNTKLSMDYSIPPGFDHCFNSHELLQNTATCMGNGLFQSGETSNRIDDEDMTKMELTSHHNKVVNTVKMELTTTAAAKEDLVNKKETEQPAAVSTMHDAVRSDANQRFLDSQYEDGELRDSAINAWKGCALTKGQVNYDMNKIEGANETNSQNIQEKHPTIKESSELGPGKEADLTPSAVLTEKFHTVDESLSGSGPNEMIFDQEKTGRQDDVQHQAATQSDEWKMNVSGWDILPENHTTNSNNFTKTRSFTARKFSYREEQKERFDPEDVEMKAESSRFYRKESLTRIGGPSTRDTFLSRGRFHSSKDGDGSTSRPERESGGLRPFGRGRYSPHNRPSIRDSGLWNRSPERSRDGGPPFRRSFLEDSGTMDNITNEGGMDTSYVTRRPFRSRSPMNQEANDYRARLGLRPTEDTGHDRFVSLSRGRGRGRSMRYTTRPDGEGSRGRFHGPTSDECDEFMTEYSPPFMRNRRCFSPIERRGNNNNNNSNNNNSYQHHRTDSRSPPARPRTRSPIGGFRRRSRSPGFSGRMRRPRSPGYRDRDHANEYNSGPRSNNSSPPSSRWVNYKERPVFNRSPPPGRPGPPHEERFSFYDSSRKAKQNEYYRSGPSGRFSDINEGGRGTGSGTGTGRPRYMGNDGDRSNNGYRRGGFVKRYNMDGPGPGPGPTKRFQYVDGFGLGLDDRDRQALELHRASNPNMNVVDDKPEGTDSRFRDFPRRQRDDGGEFKRRSRDGKDPKEESEPKDQPATNLDSMVPNDAVKEGDNKPVSGSD